MRTKIKIKILFLFLIGMVSALPARAEKYYNTVYVETEGKILSLDQFYLNEVGSSLKTRVVSKNGAYFFVEIPDEYLVSNIQNGIFNEGKIKVEKAQTLMFTLTSKHDATYIRYVRAHMNYKGILQYQGADAPYEIEVSEENKTEKVYFPPQINGTRWFGVEKDGKLTHLSEVPDGTSEATLGLLKNSGFTKFRVRNRDGTSNELPDGKPGGESWCEFSIKIPPQQVTITATANPSQGGSVQSGGTVNVGTTVNLVAQANSEYEFVNWTENSNQVSTSASYSFKATSDRSLVANFKKKALTPPTSFKLLATYQRDAIISWQRGANETEWEISYGNRKVIVVDPKAILKGLAPNTEYEIVIRAKVGESFSEPLKGSFKTEKFSEKGHLIPHLYGMKENFAGGEVLTIFWKDLKTLPYAMTYNLSPQTTSTENLSFTPLPETLEFREGGSFVLTIRFIDHAEFEELKFFLEVK